MKDEELTGGRWVPDARGIMRWVEDPPEPEPEPEPAPVPAKVDGRRRNIEHGTVAGYDKHKRKTCTEPGWGMDPCTPCRLAQKKDNAEKYQQRKARKAEESRRAGVDLVDDKRLSNPEHGTMSGYRKHKSKSPKKDWDEWPLDPCAPCLKAVNTYNAGQREAAKAAKAAKEAGVQG